MTRAERKPARYLWLKIVLFITIAVIMYIETHDEFFLLVLGMPAIPYALLWIIPPIAFYRKYWLQADPSSERFDPDSPDIPDAVSSTITSLVPEIVSLGFTTIGHFHRAQPLPNVEGFTTLLLNRRNGQAARVATILLKAGKSARPIILLAFTTEFTDGTLLATSRSDSEIAPTGLREGSMAFPEIPEPRKLFKIHEATLRRFCGDAIRRDLSNVSPDQYQRESILRSTNRLVEVGYYYLDEVRQLYYPTWRGAIMSTSRQRWPIKPIVAMLRRRRASRLLRELGLDQHEL